MIYQPRQQPKLDEAPDANCSMLSPRKSCPHQNFKQVPDCVTSRHVYFQVAGKQSMADSNVPSSVNAGVGDNEIGVVVMAVVVFV
jgi:hypothetical protein